MKIVQVMPEFGLAGAEIMCENLTYELQKLGHEVIVVSMYDYHSAITDRMEKSGVDIRYLKKKPGLDLSMIRKLKKIFKAERPDAVHTHRYVMQYAIPAAMAAGVTRRVHTVHNIAPKENGKAARKLNKFFYRHCGVTPVALSQLVQDSVVNEYQISKDRVPVIFNGVNLSKYLPKEDYSVTGCFKILHIGRFSVQKNHKDLLCAFEIFHKKHPDSELWLIGDGELKPEAENDVQTRGLSDCVKFFGLQSDVSNFLHRADIFTLPSIYEGIPITLIEAMATGLPIVATAVGGVPDMLDGESALLVPTEINAVANAFEQYYADRVYREKKGMNALFRSKTFSSGRMAEQYADLYSE